MTERWDTKISTSYIRICDDYKMTTTKMRQLQQRWVSSLASLWTIVQLVCNTLHVQQRLPGIMSGQQNGSMGLSAHMSAKQQIPGCVTVFNLETFDCRFDAAKRVLHGL